MIRVSIIYPQPNNKSDKVQVFDLDYYHTKHLPLVNELYREYGLSHWQIDQGISLSSRQSASFIAAGYLFFDSIDSVKQAFKNQGAVVMADVKNFTNIEPQISFSEIIA
jgi:uncharacterized protein (TIGR02118 family)